MISDKKFTELLNLYLDHEISAEEVRVLEAEILRSPARHTLYRQYCAMHKGCLELASTFAPQTEAAAATRVASARELANNREASPSARDKFGWATWLGGLGLAAACGALVFFVFSHKHRSTLGGHGGTDSFVPAPVLLAAPLAAPLNIPTPSPVASSPNFKTHAGAARALLVGGEESSRAAQHGFVTATTMLVLASEAEPLHALSSEEAERGHTLTPARFPVIYTAGPVDSDAPGHLDWGPLVNLKEMMESETMQPTFQVRPAVAPRPRVYRREQRRFEGGRVEMTRFQFQR